MIELTNHLAEVILLSLRHHYPDFTVKADSLRPIIEFEVSKANEQERQSEKAIDGLVKMVRLARSFRCTYSSGIFRQF